MRRTPGSTGRVGRPACDDSAAIAFRALLRSKEEREGMREGRQEGIKRRAPKILSQIRALEKIRGILSGGGGHGEGGGREAARRVVDCELRRFLLGRDPDERVVASSAGSRKRRTSIRSVPVGSDESRKTTRADRSASTAGFLHRRRVRCKNTIWKNGTLSSARVRTLNHVPPYTSGAPLDRRRSMTHRALTPCAARGE